MDLVKKNLYRSIWQIYGLFDVWYHFHPLVCSLLVHALSPSFLPFFLMSFPMKYSGQFLLFFVTNLFRCVGFMMNFGYLHDRDIENVTLEPYQEASTSNIPDTETIHINNDIHFQPREYVPISNLEFDFGSFPFIPATRRRRGRLRQSFIWSEWGWFRRQRLRG